MACLIQPSKTISELIIIASLIIACIEVFSLVNDISRPLRLSQRSYFKVAEEISYFND